MRFIINNHKSIIKKSLKNIKVNLYKTLDLLLEGCQIISPEFRYLYLNDTAIAHSGKSREELIGRTIMEIYPSIENTKMFARLKKCMEKGICRKMENEFTFPDGHKGMFELSMEPIEEGVLILSWDISNIKSSEKLLKESEEKYRTIIESTPIIEYFVSPDGIILDCNKLTMKTLGYKKKEELIGKPLLTTIYPPSSRKKAKALFLKWKKEGIIKNEEIQVITKSGKLLNVLLNVATLYDTDGKVISSISTQLDITEKKKTRKSLQESEEKFQKLFETTMEGILIVETKTQNFRYANPAICKMLGYTEKELITMDISAVHPKEDLQKILAVFKDQSRRIHFLANNIRFLRKDGTIFYADINNTNIVLDDQKYSVGFIRDITQHKHMKDLLHVSEEKFSKAFLLSPIGLAITSLDDNRLIEVNDSYCELLGYSRDEVIGYSAQELMVWVNLKEREDAVNILKEKGSLRNKEMKLRTRSGDILTLLFSAERIDVSGRPCILSSAYDITERKKAAGDLEASYKKIKEILEEIIKTLASIVEAKDPYTAGHQERVQKISIAIAKELGFSEEEIQTISTAALIHDIGKIMIPASILAKPGILNDLEFKMVKTHSRAGYDIIRNIDFGSCIKDIILQHHERLNGSGYPNHLKSPDILPEAKIIGIADVLEAMNSHRPYRTALGMDQAIKELENNKKILYDSKMVDICINLINKRIIDFNKSY